jgi:FKBP-type peptidyl-prolyl cis-trans isomerase SlyD
MKIIPNLYVAIDYTLTLDSGEVVDSSEPGRPLGFIFGRGQIISGLEKALEGKEPGERLSVVVEPEDAYGMPVPDLFREIPIQNFPKGMKLEPGMSFEVRSVHGPMMFRIHEILDDTVVADFNHPLAGERLHFDVTVVDVREPSPEEFAGLFGGCAPTECGSCSSRCE